jgi:hypothetical protein
LGQVLFANKKDNLPLQAAEELYLPFCSGCMWEMGACLQYFCRLTSLHANREIICLENIDLSGLDLFGL